MARRIAPEFNVTRITRPVTAPVDTFYNLAPLTQTAPVDTQSLEIAEALRELSPSLMGMARAMHSRETRLGVEDVEAMTPEERKAFIELESQRKGIMPQRTISALQEIARQQYVLEYRRQALAAVPQLTEPYNPDGTINSAASAQLRLNEIADGLNVPNSYYIQQAFRNGRRAVDNEIMARVTEGQVVKAQQRTEEQFTARVMEIIQTNQDPAEIASLIGKASDGFYKSGLLTDGARRATYTAMAGYITALQKSPRIEEADIERMAAVLAAAMEPQTDDQGQPYRGIRGMPLPPELYAQYEDLQNNLEDLYATVDTRNQQQAIEQYRLPIIDAWTTYAYSPGGPTKVDPIAQRQWIADNFPNLSGTQLAALSAVLVPQMSAVIEEKLRPPLGVDQDTMANLELLAMRGELTPEAIYGNRDLSLDQRDRLLSMVNEGPFSAPIVRTEVDQVSKQVESLRFIKFDLSSLSQETAARLQSRASELASRYVRELSREISKNSELMQLRASDPYEYAERVSGLLAGIPDKVQEAMSDDLKNAEELSVERIRASVLRAGESQADKYVDDVFAESPVPPDPALVAEERQKYIDTLYDEFVNDPRPFDAKAGLLTTDFHTRTLVRLSTDRASRSLPPPSAVLISPDEDRRMESIRQLDKVEYIPSYQSAVYPDLPEGQGFFGRVFAPEPGYTALGWFKSTGIQDLVAASVEAYQTMDETGRVSDRNVWKQSQLALQNAVNSVSFSKPSRTLVVKARSATGDLITKTISVPVFDIRPDGIYTLPIYIDGTYNATPKGQTLIPGVGPTVPRDVAPLPERIASNIDAYRVRDPQALAMYMAHKQRRFGSLDQLINLQTDEGLVISRGIGDVGQIQFDPRKTRFFDSRQEYEEAKAQYLIDFSGPLDIILQYVEYRIEPHDLMTAQENLIYMQIP